MAKEFFRDDVIIKIESIESTTGESNYTGRNGFTQNNRNNDIKREALNHPLLQKVLDIFEGAQIREVIPRSGH